MKLRKLFGGVAVGALALALSLSPAENGVLSPRYIEVADASEIQSIPGVFNSSITIMNTTGSPATVTVQFYKSDGTAALATPYQLPSVLAPGKTGIVFLPSVPGLANGRYSAEVLSDQPVVAIGNLLGSGPSQTGSYEGVSANDAATTYYVPTTYRNYVGTYTSNLVIQNTAATPATVTITYRDANNNTVATESYSIAANASITVDQGNTVGLPNGFSGAAIISSTQPVVAIANIYTSSGSLNSLRGFRAGALEMYLPAASKNFSAELWMSAVTVQNLGSAATTITLTFTDSGSGATYTHSDTLNPMQAKGYWQGAFPANLPNGFYGSAKVTTNNGQPIAATVNSLNARGNSASYNGFSSAEGTSVVNFANIFNNFVAGEVYVSSYAVQNVGNSTATLTIQYLDGSGAVVKTLPTETLAPGQSKGHYVPAEAPAGYRNGAVKVTAAAPRDPAGGQIVGTNSVFVPNPSTAGDWLNIAAGFNGQ